MTIARWRAREHALGFPRAARAVSPAPKLTLRALTQSRAPRAGAAPQEKAPRHRPLRSSSGGSDLAKSIFRVLTTFRGLSGSAERLMVGQRLSRLIGHESGCTNAQHRADKDIGRDGIG